MITAFSQLLSLIHIYKALHMSAGYVVFLAIAAIAALIVCTGYLRLQSEITSRSRNIASLQEELADLKEDNTTRYNAVLNSVNLEEIREKAINELGMVYASPEQIIKYKSPTSNTVKPVSYTHLYHCTSWTRQCRDIFR